MRDDAVVLFDFGDTLADQSWMVRDLGVYRQWPAVYERVVTPLALEWGLGPVSTEQIVALLAAEFGVEASDMAAHVEALNRRIEFFPTILAAVRRRRARGGRQAVVTVNPADFELLLAMHQLNDLFDLVVVSAIEGIDDKAELAVIAASRLGVGVDDTVLIDNIEDNVMAFTTRGGLGYVFRGDRLFAEDVASDMVPGFGPDDLPSDRR